MEKSFLIVKVGLPFCVRKEINEYEFVDDIEGALREIGLELDSTCPECGGTGEVYVDDEHTIACEECDGEGYYSIERAFDQYLREKGLRFREFLSEHEEWVLPEQVPSSVWGQLRQILENEIRGLEKELTEDWWKYFLVKSVKVEEVSRDGWVWLKLICKVKDVSVSRDEVGGEIEEFVEWANAKKAVVFGRLEKIIKKDNLWGYALQNDWRREPQVLVH